MPSRLICKRLKAFWSAALTGIGTIHAAQFFSASQSHCFDERSTMVAKHRRQNEIQEHPSLPPVGPLTAISRCASTDSDGNRSSFSQVAPVMQNSRETGHLTKT